ncbi:MAG: hypothetical protein R3B74_06935 [Nitrospirales bacterium]|nr:hypothetical protein [Nitrospirales bacterium]
MLSWVQLPLAIGTAVLLLEGCSFNSAVPSSWVEHPTQILFMMNELQPSIIHLSSGSFFKRTISDDGATHSNPLPEKSKSSSVPAQSQPQAPAFQDQKPAVLVPETPNKDNGQVIVTYKTKIEETQNLMRTIDESQLTKEQYDTYISINSFLEKSREAFSQDDMSMAMNLAEKAHTLVKEIVNNPVTP